MAQVIDVYMVSPSALAARFDDGEIRILSNRESVSILQTGRADSQARAATYQDSMPRTDARRHMVRITATRITVTTLRPIAERLAA